MQSAGHHQPKAAYEPPPTDVTLASLKAKLSACKPDFRGHVGPVASRKTQASVIKMKAAEEKKLAGEGPFLPFNHGKHTRGDWQLDATRSGKVSRQLDAHGEGNAENGPVRHVLPPEHHNRNKYKQELDPTTGKPVLSNVLTWTGEEIPANNASTGRKTGRRAFPEKESNSNPLEEDASPSRFRMRAVRQDVEDLTPRHRTTLIRQITLANPKFTAETRITHAKDHWDPMSQLLAHAYVEPEVKVKKGTVNKKATNTIRHVALLRRSQSARPWR